MGSYCLGMRGGTEISVVSDARRRKDGIGSQW